MTCPRCNVAAVKSIKHIPHLTHEFERYARSVGVGRPRHSGEPSIEQDKVLSHGVEHGDMLGCLHFRANHLSVVDGLLTPLIQY